MFTQKVGGFMRSILFRLFPIIPINPINPIDSNDSMIPMIKTDDCIKNKFYYSNDSINLMILLFYYSIDYMNVK